MEMIMEYLKPELVILAVACYLIGNMLKAAPGVKDWLIPFILTAISVVLSLIYVLSTTTYYDFNSVLAAVFTAVVQGILCVGLAVYSNQLIKQIGKRNE